MKSQALYRTLIGDYESLQELPSDVDCSIPAYCFTDLKGIRSKTWELIEVKPAFPLDPIRSQRLLKVLGHPILESFEQTLYIDNSVMLRQDPRMIIEAWLQDSSIAIPAHSFRQTVREEFLEVLAGKLDSRERITEQLEHYSELYPDALESKPYWSALIARENNESSRKFFEIWAQHILRYSRRDQLSLTVAKELSGIEIKPIPLDNYESEIHKWPVHSGRKSGIRTSPVEDYFEIAQRLEAELLESQAQTSHYQSALNEVWSSPSWKITKPLRLFRRLNANNNLPE